MSLTYCHSNTRVANLATLSLYLFRGSFPTTLATHLETFSGVIGDFWRLALALINEQQVLQSLSAVFRRRYSPVCVRTASLMAEMFQSKMTHCTNTCFCTSKHNKAVFLLPFGHFLATVSDPNQVSRSVFMISHEHSNIRSQHIVFRVSGVGPVWLVVSLINNI